MNYIIQKSTHKGWVTVARCETFEDAQEWRYDHALGGFYRVMYGSWVKIRFTVEVDRY